MKKIIILLSFCIMQVALCNLNSLNAQNLVPNGDFEQGPDSSSAEWKWGIDSACVYTDTVFGPNFWTVVNPSPDRLVYGDILCDWDNDTAASGKAYINVGVVGISGGWGEAVKATLLSPLEKDSSYHFGYYISFQSGCPGSPSRITFKFNGGDSIASPFINIANKKWQYYDTIFTASAISTEIEINGSGVINSCSNIDNISLTKVHYNSIFNMNNLIETIRVYPNPSNDIVFINLNSTDDAIIKVSDLLGKTINHIEITHENVLYKVNLSSQPTGIYFIKVKTEKGVAVKKFIKE